MCNQKGERALDSKGQLLGSPMHPGLSHEWWFTNQVAAALGGPAEPFLTEMGEAEVPQLGSTIHRTKVYSDVMMFFANTCGDSINCCGKKKKGRKMGAKLT